MTYLIVRDQDRFSSRFRCLVPRKGLLAECLTRRSVASPPHQSLLQNKEVSPTIRQVAHEPAHRQRQLIDERAGRDDLLLRGHLRVIEQIITSLYFPGIARSQIVLIASIAFIDRSVMPVT